VNPVIGLKGKRRKISASLEGDGCTHVSKEKKGHQKGTVNNREGGGGKGKKEVFASEVSHQSVEGKKRMVGQIRARKGKGGAFLVEKGSLPKEKVLQYNRSGKGRMSNPFPRKVVIHHLREKSKTLVKTVLKEPRKKENLSSSARSPRHSNRKRPEKPVLHGREKGKRRFIPKIEERCSAPY